MIQHVDNASALATEIENGQLVCLPPDYSGCALSVVLELIREAKSGLRLVGVPQMGLQADLLIGAGCVSSVDAAAVTLGEFGQAPRFVEAVKTGQITMLDSTCPVIHAGLQAAEKGIPFMPLRGVLGSDLLAHRPDWQVINNPFAATAQADPILLVPSITPDIALFHAPLADRAGNIWIGTRRELMLMSHAAKKTVVSVEKIIERNLLHDEDKAAGVIPSLYISHVACIPRGADPVGLFGCYEPDPTVLEHYCRSAATEPGFRDVLNHMLNA